MRVVKFAVVTIAILLGQVSTGWSMRGACDIHFYGDSTLHAFEGVGTCEPFSLELKNHDGGDLVRAPRIVVPVDGLDTDNASRDKKMREMFDGEKFPFISGQPGDVLLDAALASWQGSPDASLVFDLTIRDVTRAVTARVSDLEATPEKISFTLESRLSLDSFNLDAPSVLGIIRVADEVRVVIDVTVDRAAADPSGGPSR